jgi:hypothetical protein
MFPMKTTRTAQYLKINVSACCTKGVSVTYAAADATISWRFAPVKSTRVSVKNKVKMKRTQIMSPVEEGEEPSCDDLVKRSRMYTGSTRNAITADRLMRDAMLFSLLRE